MPLYVQILLFILPFIWISICIIPKYMLHWLQRARPINCQHQHIGLVIGDSPYGVTDEVWDIDWKKNELEVILKQVAAQNSAESWATCFFHTPRQMEMFLQCLEKTQYQEPIHLYWHNTDHSSQTPVNQFTTRLKLLSSPSTLPDARILSACRRTPNSVTTFLSAPRLQKSGKTPLVELPTLAKNQPMYLHG